jgi:hypothetical protein
LFSWLGVVDQNLLRGALQGRTIPLNEEKAGWLARKYKMRPDTGPAPR